MFVSHRPERPAAEAALEYFIMINTVPRTERHPTLCGPLFQSALPHLLRHCMYPAGFSGWDQEVEVDEEVFHRWAVSMSDAFLCCTYHSSCEQL